MFKPAVFYTMLLALSSLPSPVLGQQPGGPCQLDIDSNGDFVLDTVIGNTYNNIYGSAGNDTCFTFGIPASLTGLPYDVFYVAECNPDGTL